LVLLQVNQALVLARSPPGLQQDQRQGRQAALVLWQELLAAATQTAQSAPEPALQLPARLAQESRALARSASVPSPCFPASATRATQAVRPAPELAALMLAPALQPRAPRQGLPMLVQAL
jgi:hypothetical protein